MKIEGMELIFPREYLRAAMMVSLLSVWVLVGLFYYLNRYTKRGYFTVWTAAWLFYALWLTLGLNVQSSPPGSLVFLLKQWCVAISAVFLLWGSLVFLGLAVRQLLFGLFMAFLLTWTLCSPMILSNALQIQLPIFILIGSGSLFAGVCFYRLRKRMPFVGAGMLSLGFLLWGFYMVTYPVSQEFEQLYSVGFFAAAVLQLFIAVSMIVLVLEEVRYYTEQVRAEIEAVKSEKEALQTKILTTEEQFKHLYDQARLTAGVQKAYDELRRTQQVVVQQERLRALGQMSSGVAHDVNNALSPIVAYSELMLSTMPELPELAREYLQTIKRSGNDIAHIVSRMREFYRRRSDTEHLSKVDINQIITEVVDLTRPRWRDLSQREGVSIQIQRDLDPNSPYLLSDPSDLREALINLIFNAVDALPRGGIITFATRAVTRPTGENGHTVRHLQVEVRDNGIGMEDSVRERCLEPFFSTKAKRGGTGLGLAMVYGMMQRHEGTIEIESAPGLGTCVRLTFPIRENFPTSSIQVPAPAQRKCSLRILCIDDEPQIRDLLSDCLASFNHVVTLAENGKQGVELFRTAQQRNQPFEVVITDLGMPEMDGSQVVKVIKSESPKTPIIMMTGWGTIIKEDGETMMQQVDALISKPPRIQELNSLLMHMAAPIATRAE
jgi:signal transduction histidine kinase/ActR/RegA family two-component response regulator